MRLHQTEPRAAEHVSLTVEEVFFFFFFFSLYPPQEHLDRSVVSQLYYISNAAFQNKIHLCADWSLAPSACCWNSSLSLNICHWRPQTSPLNLLKHDFSDCYMLYKYVCVCSVCVCALCVFVCRTATLSPLKLGMNKQKIAVMMWPRCPGCRSSRLKMRVQIRALYLLSPPPPSPLPPSIRPGTQSEGI